jgi:hypothetical protein
MRAAAERLLYGEEFTVLVIVGKGIERPFTL